MVKSKLPPRSGSVASREVNSIHKKGRYNLVSYVSFKDLFTMLTTFSEIFHNYKTNSSDLPHSKPVNSNETINEGNKYDHYF